MKHCECCHDLEKCEMYGECWNPQANYQKTMNDTPTPETDAAICRYTKTFGMIGAYVGADFARQLERERDELAECLASEKITRNYIVERAANIERELAEALPLTNCSTSFEL